MTLYHLVIPCWTDALMAEINSGEQNPRYYGALRKVTKDIDARDQVTVFLTVKEAVLLGLYRHFADIVAENEDEAFAGINSMGTAQVTTFHKENPFNRTMSMKVGDILISGENQSVAVCCRFGFCYLKRKEARWLTSTVPMNPTNQVP